MSSARSANLNKAIVLVILMITMTQVGYLESMNSLTNDEETLDETNDVLETGGSGSSFAYSNNKVSAGYQHTCAILDNGDLKCWGYDDHGQLGDGGTNTNTNAPSSTAIDLGTGRTAVAVSAGHKHTCAILDNGDLKCWGYDNHGQLGDGGTNANTDSPSSTPVDLGTGRTAVAVSTGDYHTCAILDNGDLKCWGRDSSGQLGDGGTNTNTNAPSSTAIDLGTGRTAVAVSAGELHTCVILDNGDLKCWGYDYQGQLGDGGSNTDTNAPSSTAIDLGTGRTAVAVSAGQYHTCAILDNGDEKCWGQDSQGQLGDGGTNTDTNAPSSTAIDLGTGRTAVAVSAGHYHTCAILDNGDLKCWGYDNLGQLGDGGSNPGTNTNAPSSTAIDLGTGRTAVAVSAGYYHTCAILDNGDLKCWGYDNYGQLGDGGTNTNQGSPVAVSGSNTWDSSTGLSSGSGSATQSNFTASIEGADLIIDEAMTNITFQYNSSAASGSGSGSNSGSSSSSSFAYANDKMSVGYYHTCAILDNGDLKCWGSDSYGQLGDGGSINARIEAPSSTPIDLGAGRTAVAVSVSTHSCAILDNGDLKCWGLDNYGQLGDGGTNTNTNAPSSTAIDLGTGRTAVAVSAGLEHTCAILDNGDLKCWGRDYYGQLGDGGTNTNTNAPSSTAIDLGTGRTAVAVSAGFHHTCAMLDNGDVKCWGRDNNGQLGDGGTTHASATYTVVPSTTAIDLGTGRTAVALSAGFYHTCAILDNGDLKCWGRDSYGQLGDGGTTHTSSTYTVAPSSTAIDLGTGRTAVAVSAGPENTCAILDNGDLKCWGYDYSGQLGDGGTNTNTYAPSSTAIDLGTGRTAVAVSAVGYHTCAILDNGDLKCWGSDSYGQLGDGGNLADQGSPVAVSGSNTWDSSTGASSGSSGGMTNVTGATCTISPSLPTGLSIDSSTCTISGTPTVETINRTYNVTAVISGVTYQTSVWLSSSYLELTPSIEGADLYLDVPMTNVTFEYDVSAASGSGSGASGSTSLSYVNNKVAAGGSSHSCAILDNGGLKCWGGDYSGQLGNGVIITNNLNSPPSTVIDLGTGRTAVAVSAGDSSTCAILDNAEMKCWGLNQVGELGIALPPGASGIENPSSTAINLGTNRTAVAMDAGLRHTCAILDNGDLKCWGMDDNGQLGNGPSGGALYAPPSTPITLGTIFVNGFRTAVAVSTGERHTCAILDNGELKCWGSDSYGQVGNGPGTTSDITAPYNPINLGTGRTAIAVSAGYHHTCAILDNGDLKCWGRDNHGQLGDGGSNSDTSAPSATAIDLGTGRTAVAVSTGDYHTCAILDNGSVKCWGRDNHGQLGDGGTNANTDSPSSTPVDLGTGRTAVAIASADYHNCVILDNGEMKCWGYNHYGQVGDGSTTNPTTSPALVAGSNSWDSSTGLIIGVTGATCTVSPSLPTGLSIDSSTCTISGTPTTETSNTTYTATAVISNVTYQGSVWLSTSPYGTITSAVEGAALNLGEAMTPITLNYTVNANPSSGSSSGSGSGSSSSSSFAYANDKLSAGGYHTCAILDNGDLKCWGYDNNGQLGDGGSNTNTDAPSSTAIDLGTGRTAVAVSGGTYHTCAILDNGDVKCWGRDGHGQLGDGGTNTNTNAPSSTAIDLGSGRTAVAISAGGFHTCAILDNGDMKCWGRDNYGQLGNGAGGDTDAPSSTPIDLGTGRTAVAVDTGYEYTCAILDNGSLKCWGMNSNGQLGDGGSNTNTEAPSSTAIDLGTGRTAVALSAGAHHTCAILDNGDMKCWGHDSNGQLGDGGTTTNTNAPSSTAIDLGTGRTAVANTGGFLHTCAILDNGDVKCWGSDSQEQLGNGAATGNVLTPSSTPIDLGTGRTAVAISAGEYHTCAILDNGDVKCWGYDWAGQLGDGGSNTNQDSPIAVSGSDTWDSTSTGISWETHPALPAGMSISGGTISGTPSVYALNQTYTIYANQSGYSTTHELYFSVDTDNAHTVVENQAIDAIGFHPPFTTDRTAVAIYGGNQHFCAILDNGDLKCWGRDHHGQLGDAGNDTDTNAPSSTAIDLGTGRTAVAISAGAHHTCALLDNGDLKCWGYDFYGQLGDGGTSVSTNASSSTPIDLGTGRTAVAVSAGQYNTCAILDNGDLKCWGRDNEGQLGDGGNNNNAHTPSSTAIDLGTGRTAVAVSVGYEHTCAILDNGDLKCWGSDDYGQLGNGGTNNRLKSPSATAIDLGTGRTAVAITAGNGHTCAILDNDDLKCWGRDNKGQLGDGGSNTDTNTPSSTAIDLGTGRTAVAVSAVNQHTCVILDNGEAKCWGKNQNGQLGDGGSNTDQGSPVSVSGSNTWDTTTTPSSGSSSSSSFVYANSKLATASGHTCAILDNGNLKCWGADNNGQLGDGGTNTDTNAPSSTAIDLTNGTTTWTVSPALPGNLTNSSTTGEITGMVNTTMSNATYTVTATHSDGSVVTFTFNLQSLADYDGDGLPNDLPSDYDAAEGPTPGLVADTDDDADGLLDTVETNTSVYVDSSDTGTDPLNPDTDGDGICDGPNAVAGVCIAGPDTNSGATVVDTPIVLLNNSDVAEIAPFYPATGATYGLSPALPTSMQFDSSNGSIWGTPNVTMVNSTYTMWANLSDGTSTSWTFFLEVLEDLDGDGLPDVLPGDYDGSNDPIRSPPGLAEDLDDDGDGYNDTAETDTGLYLDGNNTGTDPRDPDTDDDGICDGPGTVPGVCIAGPDLTPFGPPATVVAVNNSMIPSVPPYYAGSGLTYEVMPDLPAGLTIDPTNGYLMGIPTETIGNTTFTVYANHSDGTSYSWDFTIEVLEDSDGDGSPDSLPADYDGDNDSIRAPPGLTEDLDDDNDGASDLDEVANGTEPLDPDTDGDGFCDGINAVAGVCFAGPDPNPFDPNLPLDTDGDGLPDDDSGWTGPPFADDDDDNDGYPDVSEDACGSDSLDANSIPADMDGDTICDGDDDDKDGDGIDNVNETGALGVPPGSSPINPDTDGDGICDGPESPVTSNCTAGPDMFPLDPSAWEDTDGDGYPNELFPPSNSTPPLEEDTDDDNDGWTDIDEVNCGSDPVNATDMPVDLNGDGVCDVLDLDWDDDGIPNANETDTGVYNDSSDMGTDPWNPDTDGDGFCDGPFAVFNETEMICAAGPDPFPHDPNMPMDTDGDGLPNDLPEDYIGNLVADTDDDNDGYSDVSEINCLSDPLDATSTPTNDLDGDGICDAEDPDVDGDGLSNETELADGSLTSYMNADTDGDGVCDGPSAPALPAGICVAGPDAFPDDPAAWLDTDGDGDPDEIVDGITTDLVLDTDDDNDGWPDEGELACGTNSKDDTSTPFDGDDDGICDVLDTQTLGYAINGNESEMFEAYVNQSDFVMMPNLTGMEPGLWTIEPALPAGLSFSGTARSGETGIITGIPTEASPMTNYTVTADNGRVNISFIFGLGVLNDTDGDKLPDEPSLTGLETDLDDDNDGHLDEIELKCGSDPVDQTSVPSVDEDGNCIEGKYAEDDNDDSNGFLMCLMPLCFILLLALLLLGLLFKDKVILMGPEPENTTSNPAFLSGAGTKDDPFVLKPIKALKAGSTVEAKETISIINMSPEILVNLLDLAESANDKRFRMYEVDGTTEEPGFNLEADDEGRLRLRFVFDDSDDPTYPGGTYEGLLKLGKASVYLSWTVEVKEDKRRMNKIRKEQEAAEKAEKEAKEAEEKAKAEAEAKEAEENAKAEAEAKAAEEKAAKEAEKKAKAEEKAAAAALAKKEKEESAAKKKEEAAAKKAAAAEEKAAKEAEEAEAKAKAEAEAAAAEEKAAKEAEKKAKAEEKAVAVAAAKAAKEEEEAKKKAEAEAKVAKEAEEKAKAEAAAKKKAEKKPAATKEAKKQEELQRVKKRAKSIDFKVIGEATSTELKSEVKKGAKTLEVGNASEFADSGSAAITDSKGSTLISWTGKDGNVLTGVTGVTRVFGVASVVMVKDDLQVIKGIGPFLEEKLNALGITTYRQLANMNAKLEKQVNEAIEFFPGRVKRDQWVAQAKILLGEDVKLDEKALKQAEELERIAQKAEGIDFGILGVASASEADDLQKIKGIGPFIAEKLNALGIYKFSQLANMTSEIEEEVNVAIEFFPGRVKRDEWARQAKEFDSN